MPSKETKRRATDSAVAPELALRADGADVAATVNLIDTSCIEADYWAFTHPHRPPMFGFGSDHNAREYLRNLNVHGGNVWALRCPTAEEASRLRQRQFTAFVVADELAKLHSH